MMAPRVGLATLVSGRVPAIRLVTTTTLSRAIVGVSVAWFVWSAARYLALPGLSYDEVLFVNAAIGSPTDSFIAWRVLGVPVMLMSYIGALKAYLYLPIFGLFGVSPTTIRLPAIGLSVISILLVWAIARTTFGRLTSALLVAVVALDPAFIFMTKLDFGPVVLMLLLKLLSTWAFLKLVLTQRVAYAWLLVGASGLGLFDKLNFIWFISSLAIAALLFRGELLAIWARYGWQFLAPLGMLLGAVGVSMVELGLPQLRATSSWGVDLPARLVFAAQLYASTFNGDEVYKWVFPASPNAWPVAAIVTLLCLAAILASEAVAAWRTRRAPRNQDFADRAGWLYVIVFGLTFVQIVVTNKADGPHHMMLLFPFQDLLAFVAIGRSTRDCRAVGWRYTQRARRLSRRVALTGVVAVLCTTEAGADLQYARAFEADRFEPAWSPAIYDLAAYVDRQDVDVVASVDWGLNNQLLALARPEARARYVDFWGEVERPGGLSKLEALYMQTVQGGRALLVAHPAAVEIRPGTHRLLLDFLHSIAANTTPQAVLADAEGQPLYEVYVLDDGAASER